jgi:carboxylesterase type B
MVWGVVRQLLAGLACMLLVGGASGAAAVSGQVVVGDAYPPRHIGFPGGVTGFPDLVYETVPGFRPLHLDLYRPADGPDKTLHPFVVYVHGGGWMGGHTRQSGAFTRWPDVLAALAARGYVVASIEYRLSSEARFPAAQQDVKAAIRWLRSQALTYHIDKTRGLIWGASAGGQLAALTATSCGVATLDPVGAPAESDCVQGAVTRIWTDYDRHLSDVMLQALIHFAQSGSPDSAQLKWPAWTAGTERYLSLGDRIAATQLQAARMDWLAAHPVP